MENKHQHEKILLNSIFFIATLGFRFSPENEPAKSLLKQI